MIPTAASTTDRMRKRTARWNERTIVTTMIWTSSPLHPNDRSTSGKGQPGQVDVWINRLKPACHHPETRLPLVLQDLEPCSSLAWVLHIKCCLQKVRLVVLDIDLAPADVVRSTFQPLVCLHPPPRNLPLSSLRQLHLFHLRLHSLNLK